ncbi:MAG: hypothetical protein JWP91_870 [Fibrobacteres bacterium]|nr:hypothetical protein [Fibrobacterota bacterium]
MRSIQVRITALAAGLLLAFHAPAGAASNGMGAPARSDIVLESLSGFGTGALCAYGFGAAGSYFAKRSKPLDQSGFVGGAIVGYSLGTPLGIWSYARLRGLERNAWSAGLASFASAMAAWYLLGKTYDANQQLGPTVLLLLPNAAGVLGTNIGLIAGPRQASLMLRF